MLRLGKSGHFPTLQMGGTKQKKRWSVRCHAIQSCHVRSASCSAPPRNKCSNCQMTRAPEHPKAWNKFEAARGGQSALLLGCNNGGDNCQRAKSQKLLAFVICACVAHCLSTLLPPVIPSASQLTARASNGSKCKVASLSASARWGILLGRSGLCTLLQARNLEDLAADD